jgi:hypothetical protein
MVDLAFRSSQAANVTTVVRGGLSADDSIATLELAIDKVRCLFKRVLPKGCMCMRGAAVVLSHILPQPQVACMPACGCAVLSIGLPLTAIAMSKCIDVVPSVPL